MGHVSEAEKLFGEYGVDAGERLDEAHRVHLADIQFSMNARYTIGLVVKDIAAQVGLFPEEITKQLVGRMYWQESDESLIILFPVPEIEAEMMVQIPEGHWWFRDATNMPQ